MNAERADDWVPVTERLPNDMRRVLVHGDFRRCPIIAIHGTQTGWANGKHNIVSIWLNGSHRVNHVTHWRDLPEPPKGAT